MEYESFPLPSDSNWREDIWYRKSNEIPRAQVEKERLVSHILKWRGD